MRNPRLENGLSYDLFKLPINELTLEQRVQVLEIRVDTLMILLDDPNVPKNKPTDTV
jgi:hypothetical protein